MNKDDIRHFCATLPAMQKRNQSLCLCAEPPEFAMCIRILIYDDDLCIPFAHNVDADVVGIALQQQIHAGAIYKY